MADTPTQDPFADHIAMERAIDAAWHRAATTATISLGDYVRDMMEKCPHADVHDVTEVLGRRPAVTAARAAFDAAVKQHVRRELKRRIASYRPRLRRAKW